MKILVLTVFLAVMQAAPPVPRKASDPSNRTAQNVKGDSSSNQSPSQKPQTIIQSINTSPDQNASHPPTTENAEKPVLVRELPPVSVTKDWWDKIYIAFTGILIVIGIIGVCAAYETLGEIKAQREAMQGQLTAMQGQISEMSAQTAKLDESIGVARDTAKAAKDSADAANKSADALINSERAWILAQPETVDGFTLKPTPDNRPAIFKYSVKNVGRTPARLLETSSRFVKIIKLENLIPPPSYFGLVILKLNNFLLVPDDSIPIYDVLDPFDSLSVEEVFAIREHRLYLVVYGYVKYLDVFEKEHISRFCHFYRCPEGGDPSREQFDPYLLAPPEYTKCD